MNFLLGLFFLGPMLLSLWFKVTICILYAVFHVVAGVIILLCYVIKGIYGLLKKLWEK